MIVLDVTKEIPEFFSKPLRAKMEKKMKLPPFESYIINNLNKFDDKLYERFKYHVDLMIKLHVISGKIFLPVPCYLDKFIVNGEAFMHTAKPLEFGELMIFQCHDYIPDTPTFYNLLDNQIYSSLGTIQTKSPSREIFDEIIKTFEFQPLIDWLSNTNIISEYKDKLDNQEFEIQQKIYDEWILHNLNLIKRSNRHMG